MYPEQDFQMPRESSPPPGFKAGVLPSFKQRIGNLYGLITGKNGGMDVNVIESELPAGAATAAKQDAVAALLGAQDSQPVTDPSAAATLNQLLRGLLRRTLTEYVGYSSSTKPTINYYVPGMTITFSELDTLKVFVYDGSTWVQI